MIFTPGFNPPLEKYQSDLWFLFQEGKLLVKNGKNVSELVTAHDMETLNVQPASRQYLGMLDHSHCYAAEASNFDSLPETFQFCGIRSLFNRLDESMVIAAGTANQVLTWDRNHRYCGKCGQATAALSDERARACTECGITNYPRLSPAIIVAVIRDERILLARAKRFPGKMYSVLAGFVEPGESIEDCVRREVKEEAGIEVKNIRYFGSQPWPFPDSLMIGFTAEYAGGVLEVDNGEILDAGWFPADAMPFIPSKISIARRLIDWFVDNC